MRLLALSEHNTEAKKQGVCGENRGGCGENLKFSGEKLKFAGEKKSNHHTTQHVLSPAQIKADCNQLINHLKIKVFFNLFDIVHLIIQCSVASDSEAQNPSGQASA